MVAMLGRRSGRALALLAAVAVSAAATSSLKPSYKNCIVGAGPGGLQLGGYMHAHSRDYIILERDFRPGTFYETFPRHRNLISLNKRFTGISRRRDCHFANALSPSPLRHLLKGEGGAAE